MIKSIAALGLIFALTGLPATPVQAQANPMTEICQVKAEKASGYSGARSGLSWQFGRVRLRVSGSVAVGVAYSSGKGVSGVTSFGGDRGAELREERAERKYTRLLDRCMRSG